MGNIRVTRFIAQGFFVLCLHGRAWANLTGKSFNPNTLQHSPSQDRGTSQAISFKKARPFPELYDTV
jgi:hypothetical protein